MVLKTSTPAGQFEGMETTTAAAPAPAPAQEGKAAPASAAAPSASTEVAPAKSMAMVKSEASAFQKEVEDMKGGADFQYGNYKDRVFKGVSGQIATTDGKSKLGRWIQGTMIAWDDHWEVSPGSKSEKSKDAVGYSKVGDKIDSIVGAKYSEHVGKSIDEYVTYLQNDGDYPEAKKGRYVDIAFLLQSCENGDSDLIGEVIQITLSQTSIGSFAAYQEGLKMKAKVAARGIAVKMPEDPFTFYFGAEAVSKDGNNWTKLNVSNKQPTKF